jgi:hypothetical protein
MGILREDALSSEPPGDVGVNDAISNVRVREMTMARVHGPPLLCSCFVTSEERSIPIIIRISSCGMAWKALLELMRIFSSCYFSIDCRLTHSKQKLLREYAFDLPIEKIILESNGPLYPPSGYQSDSGSHPGHILAVAQALAELKGLDMEVVLEQCYTNAIAILGPIKE